MLHRLLLSCAPGRPPAPPPTPSCPSARPTCLRPPAPARQIHDQIQSIARPPETMRRASQAGRLPSMLPGCVLRHEYEAHHGSLSPPPVHRSGLGSLLNGARDPGPRHVWLALFSEDKRHSRRTVDIGCNVPHRLTGGAVLAALVKSEALFVPGAGPYAPHALTVTSGAYVVREGGVRCIW